MRLVPHPRRCAPRPLPRSGRGVQRRRYSTPTAAPSVSPIALRSTRSAMPSSPVGSRFTMTSRAPLRFASSGKSGGGIHHQRRADGDEQVTGQRLGLGALHRQRRHPLAERDRRALNIAAARAVRHDAVALEIDPQFVDLITLLAGQAMRVGGVAVQLDHLRRRDAGVLVQPVDVLRDHRGRVAVVDQLGHGAVAAIGLRRAQDRLHLEAPPPGFPPRLLRAHEVGEIDRHLLGPDAARAAKVGDAGFGADAGAGEQHDAARIAEHAGERDDVRVLSHAPGLQNNRPPPSPCWPHCFNTRPHNE